MGTRHLDRIFRPNGVAVIGASDEPRHVGYSVLRNLLDGAFPGRVDPVNVRRDTVQGRRAYAHVGQLPETPDLAIVCTPAASVPGLVRECGAAGIPGMVILSAGFREAGTKGRALEQAVRHEVACFPDLRIIGPNCLGLLVPGRHLNASFAAQMPPAGHVALLSQSGALCTSLLDWAIEEHIGFSHFVSVGNMLDVTFADLIDYLGADPQTRALVLYVESIPDARRFLSAARAFTRTKPIIAYKAGRFPESAQAAASHTGAMAGEDAVFDAAFRRAGIERVFAMDDLFDGAELLARQEPPRGDRLAILTNAGGPGVMAADTLLALGGTLARLSAATLDGLDALLPASWSHGNPVDVLGDAPPQRLAAALRRLLADEGVDAVLVILTPQAMTDPTTAADAVAAEAGGSRVPVLASWMGGTSVRAGEQRLSAAGIPTYRTPEQAVHALMHLVSYGRNRTVLDETPRDVPIRFTADRGRVRELIDRVPDATRRLLPERESKQWLAAYGIPVVETEAAASADAAATVAQQFGFPVVLKVLSPEITHKTDVGGVRLGLRSEADVRQAFDDIRRTVEQKRPDAHIEGVTVQPMAATSGGVELILGSKLDATFGAVLLLGLGGTAAELLGDRVLELPPLNERLARRMTESLRSRPLLTGFRGRPAVDLDRLIEVLIRFSYLIADAPEIAEFDINPLLATPGGVLALDARAVVARRTVRQFSHLAIRPYPEQFTAELSTRSGLRVRVRPIRPEDEPQWCRYLARCSAESIHGRFGGLFREATHSMAARYCVVDYDRELPIVAEVCDGGATELVGVGRLVADADHTTAELAILVADSRQRQGIGTLLAEYCVRIAPAWGVRRLVAETAVGNRPMQTILQRSGFTLDLDLRSGAVHAQREVRPPANMEAALSRSPFSID